MTLAWHARHDVLIEDIDIPKRKLEIKNKPKNEVRLRLHLFRPVGEKTKLLYDYYNAKQKPLYDDYNAKLKLLYDDYNAKRKLLLEDDYYAKRKLLENDYYAKGKLLYDDYNAKLKLLEDDYNAKLLLRHEAECLPECTWNGERLVFESGGAA